MEARISSSFVTAVKEIFRENNIRLDPLTEPLRHNGGLQVVSAVGITGDLKGNIIFGCSYESAQEIVNSLFRSSEIKPQEKGFGDLQKATIGEFANQIAGRALMNLSRVSLDCNMTPPTVLTGDRVTPELFSAEEEFASQLKGVFGSAVLRVGIKTMKKLENNS